jgi:predicted membrane protein
MNKNFKIIQISGLSGILLVGIIFTGLFCGFILFPIWVVMLGWNAVIPSTFQGPVINYLQASLLWMAIILTLYILLRNSISIRFQKENCFDQRDIKDIVNEIREKDIEKTEEEVHK